MDMSWLSSIAPTVASALGGPLAGVAVSAIGSALGWQDATKEKVTDLLQSGAMTGEQIAAIKKAEIELKQHESDNNFKFAELEIRDRDSARQREIAVKDKTPAVLAAGVTLGFFGVLGFLLVNGKPLTGGDALLVMLGALGTAWASIISYYFGSTSTSARKTELLAQAGK